MQVGGWAPPAGSGWWRLGFFGVLLCAWSGGVVAVVWGFGGSSGAWLRGLGTSVCVMKYVDFRRGPAVSDGFRSGSAASDGFGASRSRSQTGISAGGCVGRVWLSPLRVFFLYISLVF